MHCRIYGKGSSTYHGRATCHVQNQAKDVPPVCHSSHQAVGPGCAFVQTILTAQPEYHMHNQLVIAWCDHSYFWDESVNPQAMNDHSMKHSSSRQQLEFNCQLQRTIPYYKKPVQVQGLPQYS